LKFLAKKSSINSTIVPSWSKLVVNWREYMYTSFLLRVEKEKLSIATYEIEQTKLDWERMKNNAQLAFDHYEVSLNSRSNVTDSEIWRYTHISLLGWRMSRGTDTLEMYYLLE
jgi:hypothetical protein